MERKTKPFEHPHRWDCPSCFHINSNIDTKCSVCETEKTDTVKYINPKNWKCPTCKLINLDNELQCIICAEKKPSIMQEITLDNSNHETQKLYTECVMRTIHDNDYDPEIDGHKRITRWKNGTIKEIYHIDEKGTRHGCYKSFYQDSKPLEIAFYAHGQLYGTYVIKNNDGTIYRETLHKLIDRTVMVVKDALEDKKITKEEKYSGKEQIKKINDETIYKDTLIDISDKKITKYDTGEIKESYYIDEKGEKDGGYERFYPSGHPQEISFYSHGEKYGMCIILTDDGAVHSKTYHKKNNNTEYKEEKYSCNEMLKEIIERDDSSDKRVVKPYFFENKELYYANNKDEINGVFRHWVDGHLNHKVYFMDGEAWRNMEDNPKGWNILEKLIMLKKQRARYCKNEGKSNTGGKELRYTSFGLTDELKKKKVTTEKDGTEEDKDDKGRRSEMRFYNKGELIYKINFNYYDNKEIKCTAVFTDKNNIKTREYDVDEKEDIVEDRYYEGIVIKLKIKTMRMDENHYRCTSLNENNLITSDVEYKGFYEVTKVHTIKDERLRECVLPEGKIEVWINGRAGEKYVNIKIEVPAESKRHNLGNHFTYSSKIEYGKILDISDVDGNKYTEAISYEKVKLVVGETCESPLLDVHPYKN